MSPADLFSSVVGHALFILTGLAGAAGGAGCGHKRRGACAAQWWPEHTRARAPPTWSPSTGRPFSEAPRAGSGGRRCATTAGRARRSCGSPPRSARQSGGAPASAAPAPPPPGRWDGAAVRRGGHSPGRRRRGGRRPRGGRATAARVGIAAGRPHRRAALTAKPPRGRRPASTSALTTCRCSCTYRASRGHTRALVFFPCFLARAASAGVAASAALLDRLARRPAARPAVARAFALASSLLPPGGDGGDDGCGGSVAGAARRGRWPPRTLVPRTPTASVGRALPNPQDSASTRN